MTKREKLLSPTPEQSRDSDGRTPKEKKAYESLLERVETKYPHLKALDKASSRSATNGDASTTASHSRGRRAVPR